MAEINSNHRSPVTTRALEILNIKPLTALQSLYEAGQYDKVCLRIFFCFHKIFISLIFFFFHFHFSDYWLAKGSIARSNSTMVSESPRKQG